MARDEREVSTAHLRIPPTRARRNLDRALNKIDHSVNPFETHLLLRRNFTKAIEVR